MRRLLLTLAVSGSLVRPRPSITYCWRSRTWSRDRDGARDAWIPGRRARDAGHTLRHAHTNHTASNSQPPPRRPIAKWHSDSRLAPKYVVTSPAWVGPWVRWSVAGGAVVPHYSTTALPQRTVSGTPLPQVRYRWALSRCTGGAMRPTCHAAPPSWYTATDLPLRPGSRDILNPEKSLNRMLPELPQVLLTR